MKEEFKFREVINPSTVSSLSENIKAVWDDFEQEAFRESIIPKLVDELSLNDRNTLVSRALHQFLPNEYKQAINILLESFGEELGHYAETGDTLSGFEVFYYMPIGTYVATYGTEQKDFDISIKALYEITKRFTSEGPIRAFLIKYPKETMAYLHKWVHDENLHVRRLVSEGSRPRLPLAGRLKEFQKDPNPVLELLEILKEDPSLYVRRSVANNLNDIGKDNPKAVTDTLEKWKNIQNEGTQWLIQHALRSLVKEGNVDALRLLGYDTNTKVEIHQFEVKNPVIEMGADCFFEFELVCESDAKLMIDYSIHFMKANGQQKPKVFKGAKKAVKAGEKIKLKKKQSFKPLSTRKYYKGKHSIELFVNGTSYGTQDFEVM